MYASPDTLFKIARIFSVGLLLFFILLLLSLLPPSINTKNVEAKKLESSESKPTAFVSETPNAVTNGASAAIFKMSNTMDNLSENVVSGLGSTAVAVGQKSRAILNVGKQGIINTGKGIGKAFVFAGDKVGGGIVYVVKLPGKALGFVGKAPVINSFIRPSDHVEVPIIDPNSPELHAAIAALPAREETSPTKKKTANQGPVWPIHGTVTTEFGVEHWPFQATHTGIDISDGTYPGTTQVKPFRPGRVVDVIYSYSGLGNHVLIDHGHGVVSVYAHLNSISVKVGQEVSLKTVIGYEGSTGASTGTHLHFEIRVNGKAANPRQFVSGNP